MNSPQKHFPDDGGVNEEMRSTLGDFKPALSIFYLIILSVITINSEVLIFPKAFWSNKPKASDLFWLMSTPQV